MLMDEPLDTEYTPLAALQSAIQRIDSRAIRATKTKGDDALVEDALGPLLEQYGLSFEDFSTEVVIKVNALANVGKKVLAALDDALVDPARIAGGIDPADFIRIGVSMGMVEGFVLGIEFRDLKGRSS